ncbi:MAG: DUF2442 domain-containing protein [Pseudomonadota bacterium]
MLKDIIRAEYVGGYKIKFQFEDGKIGVLDFETAIDRKGIFSQLADLEYFKRFYLNKELGTICWPNGQDVAPETIYEKIAA